MAAAGDRVTLEIKLSQPDTIRGRVLDPDGKPFAGVEVSIEPNITADNATTDREGRFALADVRPGSYLLIAKPPDRVQPEQSSEGSRTAIVPTYYPSAVDPSLSQQIVLSGLGGADYEIRMQTATVHRVRGIVLNADVFVDRTDVDYVQIQFAQGFNFTGKIERNGEGSESRGAADSRPSSGEVYLINPDSNEFVAGGAIQFDLMFFAIASPGRYKALIRPGLSAQIFLGETDVSGQAFPVSDDGPPVRLVLKDWAGTVRGTVEKGEGATVVLIPQRVLGAAFGQTAICGTVGSDAEPCALQGNHCEG